MQTLTVAMVQYNCAVPDAEMNTRTGLEFVRQAKALGADIVLFPECWITAYSFPNIVESDLPEDVIEHHPDFQAWYNAALDDDSPHIEAFRTAARELSIGVVITAFTRGAKRPQNSAFVINRKGDILLKYSKVHTCDFDTERMLESGGEFKVCEFDGVQIGVMICYDREYPESARMLMLKGAEIILMPNDCAEMKPRLPVLHTRAYENMVGIAMANTPGEHGGCTCAYSPIVWDDGGEADNIIVMADALSEGIFLARFDIDKLRDYRSREMMGNTYRKVKAYAGLLDAKVEPPFIRRKR